MVLPDAEHVALRVGQGRPVQPGHGADLVVAHRGAEIDQPLHLGGPVPGGEVDVHPVLPDPRLRYLSSNVIAHDLGKLALTWVHDVRVGPALPGRPRAAGPPPPAL